MTRPYEMRARAASTDRRRESILAAVEGLAGERMPTQISLADVAARAGVSVQTVLRHFGTKDSLFEETYRRIVDTVQEERATPVGDIDAAVRTIVRSYERVGDWSIRLQAQESTDELARHAMAIGRRFHRRWVAEVFAPQLADRSDSAEVLDLLVIALDVLTWKNLRRDMGLGRAATIARMCRLVEGVLSF